MTSVSTWRIRAALRGTEAAQQAGILASLRRGGVSAGTPRILLMRTRTLLLIAEFVGVTAFCSIVGLWSLVIFHAARINALNPVPPSNKPAWPNVRPEPAYEKAQSWPVRLPFLNFDEAEVRATTVKLILLSGALLLLATLRAKRTRSDTSSQSAASSIVMRLSKYSIMLLLLIMTGTSLLMWKFLFLPKPTPARNLLTATLATTTPTTRRGMGGMGTTISGTYGLSDDTEEARSRPEDIVIEKVLLRRPSRLSQKTVLSGFI
jgi:hypothetical protein